MKIRIPKQLEIFGHKYKVIERNEEKTGTEAYGSHFGAVNKIYLNDRIKGSQRESSFLHELLEAANWHQHIELSHKQIEQLEVGLYSIFKKL